MDQQELIKKITACVSVARNTAKPTALIVDDIITWVEKYYEAPVEPEANNGTN